MAEPSLQLGNGNWAGKSDNLLAYHKVDNNFYADELTFARASTGTIVNSDGLIEQVPYNLATYSEQFDNAGWSKTRSSISVNAIIAPNGTLTADKLIANTDNNSHFIEQTITTPSSVDVTFSVYAKAAGYGFLQVNNQADNSIANFDLSSGVLGTISGYTATIEDVGNGWYRCSATRSFNFAPSRHRFAIISSSTSARLESFTGNGTSGVYIYGAQLNSGSTAKTYYPTTTRLNIPRVDYLNNANGSLLLEPQRTNLVTYSEDFSNAAWIKSGASVASGFTSPDGTTNAFKLVEDTSTGRHETQAPSSSSGDLAFSFFAKKGENSFIQITNSQDANAYANFDLNLGVIGSSDIYTPTIINYGNGWYRCIATVNASSAINYARIGLITSSTSARVESYTGDGTSGVYIYGAQVEAGSYSTSYIPTSGTTVSRLADTCATTGLSDVINSTEGVLYAEISALDWDASAGHQVSLSDGSGNNRIMIYPYSETQLGLRFNANASQLVSQTLTVSSLSVNSKIAVRWGNGNYSIYQNGSSIYTQAIASYPIGLSKLNFSSVTETSPFYGNCQNLQIFKTALTNAELATLTTL